ncbi:MAG: tetratricopeptide repeat protein, partial [Candidatus Krumholzibacteria bacterium]|nr:tetratricopeptide repeat protein [Candidatus Krumholzibacteria bacterium]
LAYGEGDWSEADQQFQHLLQEYPNSSWAAAALLKRGYSLGELRRDADAEAVFRELVQRYPASNEAALARDRLD